MLVVAVATILAVQMTTDQNLAVTRAISTFDNEQAQQYAYGGEVLARQILYSSFSRQPNKDTLSEDWASNKLHYDFKDGPVEITIEDLESRLNLNGLALPADQGGNIARFRFMSLVAHLGIDPGMVDRIIDWVDQDQARQPLGAEDYDYLGLEHPYRTAGQPMQDESELRLLSGMDAATYDAIAPWVCALPDVNSTINVNTAPPLVLQAVIPDLTDDQAKQIVSIRDSVQGYDTVADFLKRLTEFTPTPVVEGQTSLGVQSSFFRVSVRAHYHDRYAYLTSVIQRDPKDGSMHVIYRDFGRKIQPIVASDKSAGADNG